MAEFLVIPLLFLGASLIVGCYPKSWTQQKPDPLPPGFVPSERPRPRSDV